MKITPFFISTLAFRNSFIFYRSHKSLLPFGYICLDVNHELQYLQTSSVWHDITIFDNCVDIDNKDRACLVSPATPSQGLCWLDMGCPWRSCSSWELVTNWLSLTKITIYFKLVELSIKDPCHPIKPKFGVE